jgi:lipopolysaccharide/colanic/teichoic acid biosynthesis glycosyltransferase
MNENLNGLIKRLIDISGSIFLLIFNSPILLSVPVLIKLDSKGPVFFKQKRCGVRGDEFDMYKFRTMVENAESMKKQVENTVDGPVFKSKGDPRVTKVGRALRKTSIDEIPQIFNVLKGEMSLVGPRPLAIEEMEGNEDWKEMRLSIKPGLTGLWQVKGRVTHKFDDWVKYDMEYIEKRSLLFDIKILIMTAGVIILDFILWRKSED